MSKKEVLKEATLVDLTDEALKEYLGYHWQALANLEREKKADDELKRLKTVAKQYEDEMFNEPMRESKAAVKAARALCEARGVRYKLPDID